MLLEWVVYLNVVGKVSLNFFFLRLENRIIINIIVCEWFCLFKFVCFVRVGSYLEGMVFGNIGFFDIGFFFLERFGG